MPEVRGYSTDELDILVADFTQVVERAIVTALTATGNGLLTMTAAAAPVPIGPDDAAAITVKWAEEVEGELQPYIASVYTGSAVQVALGTATAFPDDVMPGVPLLPDEYALTYMKSVNNRLVGVGDELWEDVRGEIILGIKNGESIPAIRDRIIAVSQFDVTRAERIARTEVHGAAESGNITQMRFMGYEKDEVMKKWLTAHDARVRLTHVHADGQEVELNEKFIVGGWSLDHPSDPSAPPGETINCRCTVIYDIQEAPKVRCDPVGKVAVTAAASTAATSCIVPTSVASLANIPSAWLIKVFNAFTKAKISPAYGGAKIQKELEALRATLEVDEPAIAAGMNDFQLMAAIDKYYVAKNKKFGEVWDAWRQSPAGKKALGTKYDALTGPHAVAAPITPPVTPAAVAVTPTTTAVPTTIAPVATTTTSALTNAAKLTIRTKWLSLSPTKVTPAWGGAKVYKMLHQLKQELAGTGVGADDLTLLRTLDAEFGFTGKPKTYESVVLEWLNTPASKKTIDQLHPGGGVSPVLKNAADALKAPAAPAPTVPVTPVVTHVATDEAEDIISTGTHTTTFDVWQIVVDPGSAYKVGDIIAYSKTQSGTLLRIRKKGPSQASVEFRGTTGAWLPEKTFGDYITLQDEYDWHADFKPKVWRLKPPPAPVSAPVSAGSKIPGKKPWDFVTSQEIWDSRNLWNNGDLVAMGDTDWRIQKTPGGLTLERLAPDYSWNLVMVITKVDDIDAVAPVFAWRVGSNVVHTPPMPSIFPGKNVGDVLIDPDEVWTVMQGGGTHNVTIAWSYNPTTEYVRRMYVDDLGKLVVEQKKTAGQPWSHVLTIQNKEDIELFVGPGKPYQFYAAKANGTMPDVVKNAMPPPSTTTPTPATPIPPAAPPVPPPPPPPAAVVTPVKATKKAVAKKAPAKKAAKKAAPPAGPTLIEPQASVSTFYPGKSYGEGLYYGDIFTKGVDAPSGTVVAVASGGHRIVVMVDANGTKRLVYQRKAPTANKWSNKKTIDSTYDTPSKYWRASSDQITDDEAKTLHKYVNQKYGLSTTGPTAPNPATASAPRADIVFGKNAGDVLTIDDIWDHRGEFTDGTIAATWSYSPSGLTTTRRLVAADGHLQIQELSGTTWKNIAVLQHKNMLTYGTWKVPLTHELLPVAKTKALVKHVQQTLGTYVDPATASKMAIGEAIKPYAGEDPDVSFLTEDEMKHIFQAFKGVSQGQLLGSPAEDTIASMWGWATELASQDPARFGTLTTLKVARAVDEIAAKTAGATNAHLFENKVKQFLSTAAGRDFVEAGGHKAKAFVKDEIFRQDTEMPAGVHLLPGQRVQALPGPGPFDPLALESSFDSTRSSVMGTVWQEMQDASRKLGGKEKQALRNWTSGAYYSWNGYLRQVAGYTIASADLKSKILYGQAGMRPLTRSLVFRRGSDFRALPTGFQDAAGAKRLVGHVVADEGFVATSTSEDFGGFGGNITWIIQAPRGTMGAWVKDFSHNRGENEFLLAAGTRLHIISVTDSGYGVKIVARVVT